MKADIKPETIKSIADGQRPVAMSPDQEAVYEFVTEIRLHQSVSDPTYERILNRFGEQGVIDIAGLCGYYTTLAMLMNVARTPLPPGTPLPLAPFPTDRAWQLRATG